MKKLLLFSLILSSSFFSFAQNVEIEFFKGNFSDPLSLQHANDDRLFVVEQGGRIKIIQPNGTVNSTPFLDISGQISNGGEQGLLGLAFHPDYVNNGYFYVNYTLANGNTQVSRFSVDPNNADIANPNSEIRIIGYTQPFSNHNGGCIAFGPDGYLYIASGDGGSGGDPGNRAQNTLLLLGKLLRLDVDNPSGNNNYGIPPDNPFVGNPDGLDEIWAYGLRNPWRFSFDFTENNIWIGDVGQGEVEEINREPATEGGINYGWRCYEGSMPYNTTDCPPANELTFPIAEYSSGSGSGNCSVTGGHVYRGSVYTDIAGLYFFADYCSGLIGTVDAAGNMVEYGNFSGNWVSFGEDVNKELYIVDIGGDIYKIKGGEIASIEDFSLKNVLSVLPNPASKDVIFSLKNDMLQTIQLFDVRGSLVYSEENISSSEKTISIENLNTGIYFAKVISDKGQSAVKKLIVQ
ncbi:MULTISPECIES: PQQ-dependent sugar dehydrogenase [Aequorivita]|uniref:PQQ-dependent sugar dehydrogenase n=1 Tax=Aequorivita iocasae TaxID=2803865 RepID=A0ABX7DRD2_9FLAO|nr:MULTISPECIES: PQQ-dependent sugar dehydrogenase [Aequorivita]QQX76695.1 PQQ-dependent sugar dehydrogenase [Aequorivita iocasae]UCA56167.1 PQQ-dependent sugar dehydrogenase [Aequorivita sp. F7]